MIGQGVSLKSSSESLLLPQEVTVCIPTFNNADTIGRCLDSVLTQTLLGQCWVIDDNSTDETVEVCRARDDPKLRIVINAERRGLAQNHNVALTTGTGDLLLIAHADDELSPGALETLSRPFRTPTVVLSAARRNVEGADEDWNQKYGILDEPLGRLAPLNRGWDVLRKIMDAAVLGNTIGEPTSVMMRRSTAKSVGGFRRDMRQMVDYELWLRMLAEGDLGWSYETTATRHHGTNNATANNQLDPMIEVEFFCQWTRAARRALLSSRQMGPLLARYWTAALLRVLRSAIRTRKGVLRRAIARRVVIEMWLLVLPHRGVA